MKSMTMSWVLALLACGCMLVACDQDSGTEDSTTDTVSEPTVDTVEEPADEPADEPVADTSESYSVSGTVGRTFDTCPPVGDASGTLCLSFRTDCADAGTEVVAAEVASIDIFSPGSTVSWSTEAVVPNGSYQLHAFLDDDGSGCAAPTTGDMICGDGCVAVEVAGADVTGVTISFTTKQP
jgi:hypothetical protein